MKQIVCESCKNAYGDHGSWVIFDSVIICEGCRLAAIRWMRESGFDFGHPFIREISRVTPR